MKWDIQVKITNANNTTETDNLTTTTPDQITERQLTTQLKKQLMTGYVKSVEIVSLKKLSDAEFKAWLDKQY